MFSCAKTMPDPHITDRASHTRLSLYIYIYIYYDIECMIIDTRRTYGIRYYMRFRRPSSPRLPSPRRSRVLSGNGGSRARAHVPGVGCSPSDTGNGGGGRRGEHAGAHVVIYVL